MATEVRTIRADSLTVLSPSESKSADDITPGPCDADVSNGWRTSVFDTVVVTNAGAEIVEESLAATEQDRHNREMHFID